MKKPLLLCLLFFTALLFVQAQKKVLGYPFQFEKSFLAKGDYDAYFLNNPLDDAFALILKDNKKVEYIWLNKSFKILDSVPSPIGNTVLDQSAHKYIGGTADESEYHFVYNTKSVYIMETVNFRTKAVSNKKILELPSAEKLVASFSDHNVFYVISVDDKAEQLVLYMVNASGEFNRRSLPMATPGDPGTKNKGRLSQWLTGLKVIKDDEEPELSSAIKGAKLFSRASDLRIVINSSDYPTHIFTIPIPGYTISEKLIEYGPLVAKEDKGKTYISSFLKEDRLFSLILNKKSIRITVHEVSSGKVLNKFDFTDESGDNQFAESPVAERRMGNKVSAKDLGDIKKVIRAFTNGTEGIMIAGTNAGKLVVTAGTYDLIVMSSGGGGGWQGGWQMANTLTGSGPNMVWNPNMYYRPGYPSYTSTSARYYNTTYFKMLLDSSTLKIAKGRVPRPVPDQIKDYIDDTNKKAKATNQFAIGKNQYYGYYDRDMQEYVIEQIRLYN